MPKPPSMFDKDALKRLVYWITEREKVRIAKEGGKPTPWTKDPIIANYRFCNVRRNDDKVTRWIHDNWLRPFAGDQHLWFAMVVARLVNWPDTLKWLDDALFANGDLGKRRVLRWGAKEFVTAMHSRRAQGHKVFSGAYIVSTNGRTMDKAEYLARHVLTPLWAERGGTFAHIKTDTLASFHERLMRFDGMGSFMAAQVVADIKYDKKGPLYNAEDWLRWAAPGPGSKRGLNRVMGADHDRNFTDKEWKFHFDDLYERVIHALPAGMLDSAQDLQNCLCEFDKFERVRMGQGKPRSGYVAVQQ